MAMMVEEKDDIHYEGNLTSRLMKYIMRYPKPMIFSLLLVLLCEQLFIELFGLLIFVFVFFFVFRNFFSFSSKYEQKNYLLRDIFLFLLQVNFLLFSISDSENPK